MKGYSGEAVDRLAEAGVWARVKDAQQMATPEQRDRWTVEVMTATTPRRLVCSLEWLGAGCSEVVRGELPRGLYLRANGQRLSALGTAEQYYSLGAAVAAAVEVERASRLRVV